MQPAGDDAHLLFVLCTHPQVEYSIRGEAAVVGKLQAVKNGAHLLLHGLVAMPIADTEKICTTYCTYPQVGYGEGGEEAVAGDLEAGIGGNGHEHRHVPHHRQQDDQGEDHACIQIELTNLL